MVTEVQSGTNFHLVEFASYNLHDGTRKVGKHGSTTEYGSLGYLFHLFRPDGRLGKQTTQ